MNYLATRPLEYVCFFPMEVPAAEGDAYMYIFLDVFSQKLFLTGVEGKADGPTVLEHVRKFMTDKDFIRYRNQGFTLILHKYGEMADELDAVIRPYGGKFIVDDPFVAVTMAPAMEYLFKNMAGRNLR